jgi:hypothetical protein
MPRSNSGQQHIVICDPSNGTASPDPVRVTGPNAKLIFKLKSPGQWQWSGTNPITIGGNPPSGRFSGGSVSDDGHVRFDNSNDANASHPYTFSAVPRGGGARVDIDPTIQNSDSN